MGWALRLLARLAGVPTVLGVLVLVLSAGMVQVSPPTARPTLPESPHLLDRVASRTGATPAIDLGGNVSVSTSTWPGFAGAGNLSGQAASAGPSSNATLWSAYVGARPSPAAGFRGASSPVVANGIVYVGTGIAGGVVALNSTTGALVWAETLPPVSNVTDGLLVADHRVFVPIRDDPTTDRGVLYVLNASTGAQEWNTNFEIRGPLLAPPNLIDGTVVGADDGPGFVYGWDENGTLRYSYQLSEPTTQAISVATVGSSEAVGLVVSGGSLSAFDPLDGGPSPLASWSPLDLPHPINGSAAQTPYRWTDPVNRSTSELPLALVADNGGPSATSQVDVVAVVPPTGPSNLSSPVLASWSTPAGGEGFEGTPTVLGQSASNLSFAVVQDNGSVAVFHFWIDGEEQGELAPVAFLPWASGNVSLVPWGSVVAHGGPGGDLYLGTPQGRVVALSVASRSVLWSWNGSVPFLASPALVDGRLFLTDENGTLHAFGGGAPPPGATRLLISGALPSWVEGSSRTNVSVSTEVWYANGTKLPVAGAHVVVSTRTGSVTGSPGNSSSRGVVNVTYQAPSVSVDQNATLYVNASWKGIANGTVLSTVVVPPKDVNDTPLWIAPLAPAPAGILSGQSAELTFRALVGTGGPPLVGAYASFLAFGGTSSVLDAYTNSSGEVNTTFTAATSSGSPFECGLTLTLEKAGYQPGTYSWLTEVDPLAELHVRANPSSLLVVAGASSSVLVQVNTSAGAPLPGAVVSFSIPADRGNLSLAGGETDAQGELSVVYEAPGSVAAPGVASSILVTVESSGYATAYASLALTIVPNATSPASSSPSSSASNPLSSLTAAEAWGLVALVAVLALMVVLLLLGRRRGPAPPSRVSVWEELAADRSEGSSTPAEPQKDPALGPSPAGSTDAEAAEVS